MEAVVYNILAALAGFLLAAGIFRWQNRRVLERRHAPHLTLDSLDYPGAGFYLYNCITQEELCSPGLLELLRLDDFSASLERLEPGLDLASFAALKDAQAALGMGKNSLRLHLKSRDGRDVDCIARAVFSDKQQKLAHVLWFIDMSQQEQHVRRLQAETERLKQEVKQLSLVLNALQIPVWRRSDDLAIHYCNMAYSEVVEEATDTSAHGGLMELHKQSQGFARQVQQQHKPGKERRHVIAGGQRRLYEITEVPLPEDKIQVGFAQDLTETETLNEELQRYVSAQSDLLESSTSAMAVYGPDMRLKSFNYAFVSLWKLDEMWLDSQPLYGEVLEQLREKRKLPEQANFPAFKQQQLRLFKDLIAPHEEFFYLPDGRTLRVIAIPHALGGLLFAYEDVTDRLALERSYNTLIAVQKETINRLHEGIAVFGEDGCLKLYNPVYAELWQLDEKDVNSEPHFLDVLEKTKQFYRYDDWEQFKEQMLAQAHTRTFSYQRLERTDGTVLDWSAVPLPDGATLFSFLDITPSTLVERSLREKAKALEEADRVKTEFLANVSYELRSPLTSISGFSEMLQQDYFGKLKDQQREYVESIYQSAQHLMHLINDILDLATIEAGYMRLEVTRFDIHAMVQSVLALVKARAREQGVRIKSICSPRIGVLLADETRIKQALFNLLNNALKYTDTGGDITVGALAGENDEVMLWVEDTGAGIAPEEQEAVFGKFYKGTMGKPRPGTGLGLPMVKSFVEMHGGRIELKSTPGVGTKVTCYLPRSNPNLEQYTKNVA